MPRRRLHGETQKRRKKKLTRELKRKESIVRSQVTQSPAPFERSPQVGREDLEFLEAMREMDVRRIPGRPESPLRREAVTRVQFQVDEAEKDGFAAHMEQMGVRPLEQSTPPRAETGAPPSAQFPETEAPAADSPAPPTSLPADVDTTPPKTTSTPTNKGAGYTTFVEDAESMAALLDEAGFDPGEKFRGAPEAQETAAPERGGATRANPRQAEHLEPDDTLDLHGKTQEEAIAMVQNFLLTCHRRRLHHVLIITGRGLNSGAGGPVLKEAVQRWLERNASRFARGFFRAPPRHGGDGAIWIVLR